MFGDPPIPLDEIGEKAGLDTYGKIHSRFRKHPGRARQPAGGAVAARDHDSGERQIRALFVSAGNPVLSVPDGDALEEAFGELDLMVSLDFYVNETNSHADYVLPATTFLEREDVPVALMGFFSTPFAQVTERVVEPAGEARQEWEVVERLSRAIGIAPYSLPALRHLARLGIRISPRRLVDLLLRTRHPAETSSAFAGRASRWRSSPVIRTASCSQTSSQRVRSREVRHKGGRVHLRDEAITSELERLASVNGDRPEYPLKLIGMRELRSHNSWMHNAALLMRGGRSQALRINPDDAASVAVSRRMTSLS